MTKVVKEVLVSLNNKSSLLLSHLRAINNFCSPYTMYIHISISSLPKLIQLLPYIEPACFKHSPYKFTTHVICFMLKKSNSTKLI